MSKNKKYISTSLLLALIGIVLISPIPWNHAHSNAKEDIVAFKASHKASDTVCTQIRLLSQEDSCKAQEIDQLLTSAYKKGRFSGQFLYAEQGRVIYKNCFGFSNIRARRDSIKPTSAFQLASLSKPFTAVAVMQLYQEGKLDINRTVKTYLPDFPFEKITVKELLQHRSGLQNYIYAAENFWPDKENPLQNSDLDKLMGTYAQRLDFKPGSRFRYCNTNYAYLALLVEKISGKSFGQYFEENIAQPLQMQNTFVYNAQKPQDERDIVRGYSYSRRTGFYQRRPDYLDGVVGDKGLMSNVEDLFRFDQALYSDAFLADTIRDLMFTPAVPLSERHENDYGLGFRIKQESPDHQIVYHNGWWKGFRSYFIHDYQRERTLIWLVNRSDVTINPYIEKIFDIAVSFSDAELAQETNANHSEDLDEAFGS